MKVTIWVPFGTLAKYNKLMTESYERVLTDEMKDELRKIPVYHYSPAALDRGEYIRVLMDVDMFVSVYEI